MAAPSTRNIVPLLPAEAAVEPDVPVLRVITSPLRWTLIVLCLLSGLTF